MKNVKMDIFNALKTNQTLIDLGIESKQINIGFAPIIQSKLPAINFWQVTGTSSIADGKMCEFKEIYSFDIFAKTMIETENIALVINAILNEMNYVISMNNNTDLFEEDTKIYHKALRYKILS